MSRLFRLRGRKWKREPVPKSRMSYIGAGEIVAVHLIAMSVEFGLDEEVRTGSTGATPDYVRGLITVPCRGL